MLWRALESVIPDVKDRINRLGLRRFPFDARMIFKTTPENLRVRYGTLSQGWKHPHTEFRVGRRSTLSRDWYTGRSDIGCQRRKRHGQSSEAMD